MCIGYKFALMEMKVILATLMKKFWVSEAPECKVEAVPMLTVRPKGLKLLIGLATRSWFQSNFLFREEINVGLRCYSSLLSMIDPDSSRHFLFQSDAKRKPTAILSLFLCLFTLRIFASVSGRFVTFRFVLKCRRYLSLSRYVLKFESVLTQAADRFMHFFFRKYLTRQRVSRYQSLRKSSRGKRIRHMQKHILCIPVTLSTKTTQSLLSSRLVWCFH